MLLQLYISNTCFGIHKVRKILYLWINFSMMRKCHTLWSEFAIRRHMFFGGPKPSLFSKKDKEDQEENLLGQ